jgi:hypothetical protein
LYLTFSSLFFHTHMFNHFCFHMPVPLLIVPGVNYFGKEV